MRTIRQRNTSHAELEACIIDRAVTCEDNGHCPTLRVGGGHSESALAVEQHSSCGTNAIIDIKVVVVGFHITRTTDLYGHCRIVGEDHKRRVAVAAVVIQLAAVIVDCVATYVKRVAASGSHCISVAWHCRSRTHPRALLAAAVVADIEVVALTHSEAGEHIAVCIGDIIHNIYHCRIRIETCKAVYQVILGGIGSIGPRHPYCVAKHGINSNAGLQGACRGAYGHTGVVSSADGTYSDVVLMVWNKACEHI